MALRKNKKSKRKRKDTMNMSKNKKLVLFVVMVLLLGAITATAIFASDGNSTPTLCVESYNLSYSDSLYMLYAISNDGFDRNEHEIKMLFWTEKQDEYVLGTESFSSRNEGKATVKEKDCLVFYSDGLAAKQMTEDVYCRACVEIDGKVYYSDTVKFSVLEYVHAQREKGGLDDKKNKLFDTMLEYGAAAQDNFDHKHHRPANGKYYKVNVVGGTLSDGFTYGRFQEGETVELVAPETLGNYAFLNWEDENGNIVATTAAATITAKAENKTYTAKYYSVGLAYTFSSDKTYYTVSGIGACTDKNVMIPSTYNGKPVAEIKNEAFKDKTSITGVNIPNSVTFIGERAFLNCDSLESITVSKLNSAYKDIDGNLYTKNGDTILAYAIGKTETDFAIPDGVVKIGKQAFQKCKLVNVTIPASVTEIVLPVFGGDSANLTNINVDENNTAFKSINGNLYTKNGDTLLRYAIGKSDTEFAVPDGVKKIENCAFGDGRSLVRITLPNSVTELCIDVFAYCVNLEYANIPDSVTVLSDGVFVGCSSITNISVGGNNTLYSSIDGHLYSKDGKTLIQFAGGKAKTNSGFVVPDGVEHIATKAFMGAEYLQYVTLPDGVKSIGSYAFRAAWRLRSINIPEGVTSIGKYAFYNCVHLKNISIPDSVTSIGEYVFQGCGEIQNVTIGNGVTSIPNYAFRNCYAITSVTLGNSVKSIGVEAFNGCSKLTGISFPDSLESIGNYAFNGCTQLATATFGSGLKTVGDGAFNGCSALARAILPDGVTYIGDFAFASCTSLASVDLGNSVETIGNYALRYCPVSELTVPETVKSIGDYAFEYSALSSINIPDGVTNIGTGAFRYCVDLTAITVGKNNTVYKDINGNLYNKSGDTLIQYALGSSAESFIIPDGVTAVADGAFWGCSNLTSVTIPESVTSIGYGTFRLCSELANITVSENNTVYKSIDGDLYTKNGDTLIQYASGKGNITLIVPDGVKNVAAYALYGCDKFMNLFIPDSATSIGVQAFSGCSGLTNVYYGGTKAEWSKILINSGNTELTDSTLYYYSESAPTTEGNYWHYVNGVVTGWS